MRDGYQPTGQLAIPLLSLMGQTSLGPTRFRFEWETISLPLIVI